MTDPRREHHAVDRLAPQAIDYPDETAVSDKLTSTRSIERLACLSLTGTDCSHRRLGALAPSEPVAVAESVAAADRVTECVVLSTCNRLEAYVSCRTPDDRSRGLDAVRGTLEELDEREGRVYTGTAVVEHLARLAAGLESPILGESEIMGQLRRAVSRADDAGLIDGALGRGATCGIRAGRTCRTETDIDVGELDYADATLESIERAIGAPDRIAVVGAGTLIESVVDAVGDRWPSARIDAANRTPDRARPLVTRDGTVVGLETLSSVLESADAVVTATAADDPVITPDAWSGEEGLTIVDLGTPPDVSPALASRAGVRVFSLEDVQRRASDRATRRQRAVPAAERVVERHVTRFVVQERENRAEDTLRALHEHAAAVRETELERARNRLRDGEADPETVLEEFASSLAGRLLGPPTDRLRDAARENDPAMIRTTRKLFDLDVDHDRRGDSDGCQR